MTNKNTYSQRSKSLEQRFWEKVDLGDGCWVWKSAIGSRGYGIFWVGGKSEGAHQTSYRLSNGPIKAGLLVMHTCDRPACVRPDHLVLGTTKDNALDAKAKGRVAFGERNGGGKKLSEESVVEIKRLSASREASITGLARMFGVSVNTIKMIRRGRLWAHVRGMD